MPYTQRSDIVAGLIAGDIVISKTHARDRCMECAAPPTKVIIWAEGAARCWFCTKHAAAWVADNRGAANSVTSIEGGVVKALDQDDAEQDNLGESSQTGTEDPQRDWDCTWLERVPAMGVGEFVYQRHWRGLPQALDARVLEPVLFDTENVVHGDLRVTDARGGLHGWSLSLGEANFVRTKDLLVKGTAGDPVGAVLKGVVSDRQWLDVGPGQSQSFTSPEGEGGDGTGTFS